MRSDHEPVASRVLRSLLLETKDGEWGAGAADADTVAMRVIRGTDFDDARQLDLTGVPVRYIAQRHAARKSLRAGDVLIETAGGSKGRPTGRTVFIREDLFNGSELPLTCASFARFMRFDANQIEPEYAYWWLQSLYQSGRIETYQVQHSGIARFQFTKFADEVLVPLPERHIQRLVVDTLGAIERRMTSLRQTNATLESMAQALFKNWFIDFDPVRAKAEGREPDGMDAATAALFPAEFEESALGLIPKGWSQGKLEVICSNPRVQAKPGQMPPETPYIGLEHMPRKSIALGDAGTAEGLGSGKFWFERNDVLFGKLRPYFHKVGLAPVRGVCSTDILVLRPRSPGWLGFLAMHASSDALISYTTQLSNGARMPRTSWHDVGGFDVTLPPHTVASAFDAAVKPMFERIHANIESAQLLASLRDTLLPRLISGKLRLPEAREIAEGALA